MSVALSLVGCDSDDDSADGGTTTSGAEGDTNQGLDDDAADDDGPASAGSAEASAGSADPDSDDSQGEATGSADESGGEGSAQDLDMEAEDFTCILDWPKVRRFRITNLLGNEEEALSVANSDAGGIYPVGTVIQLIPDEAMVKRAAGWSALTNDWEFFSLSTSAEGTEILDRGTTDVINQFNGNCYDCHSLAEKQWDLVCEDGRGCDPLPLTPKLIENLQNADQRCGE